MIQNTDFAIQLTGGPLNDWLWAVLDENGDTVSKGAATRQEQARREAEIVAGSLSVFRRVTKGGW